MRNLGISDSPLEIFSVAWRDSEAGHSAGVMTNSDNTFDFVQELTRSIMQA